MAQATPEHEGKQGARMGVARGAQGARMGCARGAHGVRTGRTGGAQGARRGRAGGVQGQGQEQGLPTPHGHAWGRYRAGPAPGGPGAV